MGPPQEEERRHGLLDLYLDLEEEKEKKRKVKKREVNWFKKNLLGVVERKVPYLSMLHASAIGMSSYPLHTKAIRETKPNAE